jgi:hypothetical protein
MEAFLFRQTHEGEMHMRKTSRYLGPLFFSVAMMLPVVNTGCAARARVYDSYHSDYHRWDDRAYRRYLAEKHEPYRDFKKQDRDKQRDYWNWRHDHPDDRH